MKVLKILITTILIILMVSCSGKEPIENLSKKFTGEVNFDKKVEIFEETVDNYSNDKYITPMLAIITGELSENKKFSKAVEYLEKYNEFATSDIHNNIAWKIFESKENNKLGLKIAKMGVEIARERIDNPDKYLTIDESREDWISKQNASLGYILDTFGSLQKESGNIDEALPAFEEAVKLNNEVHVDINDNYITTLIDKGDLEKAKSELEGFISNGTHSNTMKDLLKDVFVRLGGNESKFTVYLSKFEKKAKEKMINKLKEEIKNEPAQQFSLLDLNGNTVSLSDFKGKTVILDFWATWCRPCVESFPAMKKAMGKYKNDNIKFLFVNTWERVEDKKTNASKFITENNYPFQVLLDEQNEVVKQFNVQGIPTKFIIDKNQNVRFESIGYSGKEEELLAELEQMISMLK